MNLKPLGKRVVLSPTQIEETTKGGIILPGASSKKESNIAEVIALGDDVTTLKSGDRVVFDKYKTTIIKEDDKEYFIIDLEDVLAIVL